MKNILQSLQEDILYYIKLLYLNTKLRFLDIRYFINKYNNEVYLFIYLSTNLSIALYILV